MAEAPSVFGDLASRSLDGMASVLDSRLEPEPERKTYHLTLAVDEDTLVASLTDQGAHLLVGEVQGLAARLARLQQLWTVPARDSDSDANAALLALGQGVAQQLLPERIRRFFASADPCQLRISMDPSLALVPWEACFDGVHPWMAYHQVTRSFLGVSASASQSARVALAQGKLRVLLVRVSQRQPIPRDYVQALSDAIAPLPHVQLDQLAQEQLKRALELNAAHGYDVLHLIGTLRHSLEALQTDNYLAHIARNARLLLLDDCPAGSPWNDLGRALAAPELHAGVLCCVQRPAGFAPDAQELTRFYKSLSRGVAVGDWCHLRAPRQPRSVISVFGEHGFTLLSQAQATDLKRGFRQVTSLSYDMVGSTTLMQRLGLEGYSLALHEYHRRFGAIIKQWGGFSNSPQGNDGIMSYFGAEQAREDAVRCALFAALDLVAEARRMGIQIRIGVATGQVAVTDVHLVGLTVHLAARLQNVATPGEILVSGTTAELARSHFGFTPFAYDQVLKGFNGKTPIFRVEQARTQVRWSQWSDDRDAPLIGRAEELAALQAQLDRAARGQASWLHLSGEAGVGKSKLISVFAAQAEGGGQAHVITYRCAAQTGARAFGPIIAVLERHFNIQPTDSVAERVAKVDAVVVSQARAAFAPNTVSYLLELPRASTAPTPLAEPSRRMILNEMTQWMLAQARRLPLLLVVEDIQWADPSTLDFLIQLHAQGSTAPLLTILTQRLDQAPAQRHAICDASLHLNRLPVQAVRDMIQALARDAALPPAMVATIEAKSDGIPLFVEMSTRMVLDLQLQEPASLGQLGNALPIPVSVRDLLTNRLDTLGAARPLAQLCGGIGREVSLELLSAITESDDSPVAPERLNRDLSTLVQSGLLVPARNRPNPHFYFRHALIQDAAYQSMWESDRKVLHRCIAQTVEAHFPEITRSQPEVLAYHHGGGGDPAQSLKWHMLAVRKHKRNEAHQEALWHLDAARALLPLLPDTPARTKQALEIELACAGQLIATQGYGAQAVGDSYQRALSLSETLGDKKSQLRAQLGIEAYHFLRGDFALAHRYIAQANQLASEFNDGLTAAQCQWAVANILFHQGEIVTALARMEDCIQVCQREGLASNLVQSPEVMSLMYSSFCLWELGLPDQALARAAAAVSLADTMHHRLGLGQALGMQSMVELVCGLNAEALASSQRAIDICEAGEHAMWTAHARFIHGCAVAALGEPERGLNLMDAADALWASTGAVLTRSFYLTLRAQVSASLKRAAPALNLIEQAWAIVTTHGERYYEPEVLRVKGELLLAFGTEPDDERQQAARSLFDDALAAARVRQLKSLELRTATSLARLLWRQGRGDEAGALLQAALDQISEAIATQDYQEARRLLEDVMGAQVSI